MAERRVKLFSNTFMAGSFAVCNFVLVVMLMWTVSSEYAPEWKKYQREYYQLLAERTDDPEMKRKTLSEPLTVQQTWNPKLEIIDRCMTCHMGVGNPKMTDVPEPYKVHPNFTQHNFAEIGCTSCHEGQGPATTVHAAHVMDNLEERFGEFEAQHIGWDRPMLPLEYVQASCHKCHNVMAAPIPGADHLNAGWQLVQEKGCKTCHYIVDDGAKQAPELSTVGTKFYNESGSSEAFHDVRFGYLKESLRCPQANVDEMAAKKCQATLTSPSPEAGGVAALSGKELVQKFQCTNCHNFEAPVKIVGPPLNDIGQRHDAAYIRESILEPDKVVAAGYPSGLMKATLSGVGFYKEIQATPGIVDSLVDYLSSLKGGETAGAGGAAAAGAPLLMPNFNLTDEELHNVVTFLLGLREHTVQWPQKSFAKAEVSAGQAAGGGLTLTGKSGEEVVKVAGCVTCHKFDGPERLVGPSLWDIGARQDKDYIRESILDPDKVVVSGYPSEVMKATLTSTGFYQHISVETLEKLVDYLAALKGKS
jgi:cytochrome c551/c552